MFEVTGHQLATVRECLGLTQAELAEEVGVHANTLARYERDEVSIPPPVEKLLGHVWVNALHDWAVLSAEDDWNDLDEEEREEWRGDLEAFCERQAARAVDQAWAWYEEVLELDDEEDVPFWRHDWWNDLMEQRETWLEQRDEAAAEDEQS